MKKIKASNIDIDIIVDDEDYNSLSRFSWTVNNIGYAVRQASYIQKNGKIKRKIISMSRYIMNPPSHLYVDHINRVRLDNRKENLRICTPSENVRNRIKNSKNYTSKYNGVSFSEPYGLWVSSVTVDGVSVGEIHDTEIEAALHYNYLVKKYNLKFNPLNTIIFTMP